MLEAVQQADLRAKIGGQRHQNGVGRAGDVRFVDQAVGDSRLPELRPEQTAGGDALQDGAHRHERDASSAAAPPARLIMACSSLASGKN